MKFLVLLFAVLVVVAAENASKDKRDIFLARTALPYAYPAASYAYAAPAVAYPYAAYNRFLPYY